MNQEIKQRYMTLNYQVRATIFDCCLHLAAYSTKKWNAHLLPRKKHKHYENLDIDQIGMRAQLSCNDLLFAICKIIMCLWVETIKKNVYLALALRHQLCWFFGRMHRQIKHICLHQCPRYYLHETHFKAHYWTTRRLPKRSVSAANIRS